MPKSSHRPDDRTHRFELTHGWRLPAHQHRRGHLVYAATGVLSIVSSAGSWIAPRTRVAWTPAGFSHHHEAHGHTDMRILFLDDATAKRLPKHPAVLAVSPLVREVLLVLTDDAGSRGAQRSRVAQHRLAEVVVDELRLAPDQPLHLPEPRDARLRALTALLHKDPSLNETLARLGKRIGASERTLTRLFHDEVGMNFRQWRAQLRLHHALKLLADGSSVTDTALACGWSNPTSFIETFTSLLGETPGRFRSQLAAAERAK
ncbi:AraC family transcriptional regulator [Labilithrix luteola]|uniref:AraC family transcriptional regulator n=1 Tax=Labilithrix luteola TaxID=1391654 RepID=UPI000AFA9588|nr:helix-turn-helix transcriptional regulator [Labilithrix luteola]